MDNWLFDRTQDRSMEIKIELNHLFSSITESPSKTENFKRIHWICENNDEVKTILLSIHSLKTFKLHLKNWSPEKSVKAIIENLKLLLFLAEKLPELKYELLSTSKYISEVLKIFNSCLRYLIERKQEEIDKNCMLSLVFSYVSKYAIMFCKRDSTNDISTFGQLFFQQALSFLRYKKFEFAKNPSNCLYILILTSTMNAMMSKFSAYRSLFIGQNGIQYCLNWLSSSYKNKSITLPVLYCDLQVLIILENFVDEPYFSKRKTAIAARLIKYLRCHGERITGRSLMKESDMVFQFVCTIIIKMTMKIEGFKKDICEYQVKQLLLSFLNKYSNRRTCAKTIYTTLLVLEETNEALENHDEMDFVTVMDECERLSNILLLSKVYNISSSNDVSNCTDRGEQEVLL